jgi:hypothetical protein
MSRREDNVSCIDVTIVDRFAHSALPSAYSKIFPAFRAGAAVTPAAGLGGKCFIDFIKPHACVIALVQQHGSECTPTRIEHRLCQSSLCKSGGIHVANEDRTVGLDQTDAQLMQEVFAPIRDLGVNRSGSVSMAGALGDGQRGLKVAVEALSLASIANGSDLKRNPTEGAARTAALAPSQPDFSMLPASSRVFFRDLLHRLNRKMQGTVTAKLYPVTPWQTSRNAHSGRHARLPVSLSLAGLKAGVSRGEIG